MRQKNKKIAIWVIVVISFLLIANVFINIGLENKIEQAIKELPPEFEINYKSIDVNVLSGNVTLEAPEFKMIGKTTDEIILNGTIDNVNVNNVSLWDYLVNSKISVGSIELENPKIKYFNDDNRKTNSSGTNLFGDFKTTMRLDKFLISNADIIIANVATDSVQFSCSNLNFEMNAIKVNDSKAKEASNFSYADFQLNARYLKYAISTYENLSIDSFRISKNESSLNNLELNTKYSKSELSKIIDVERDYFSVKIKDITCNDINVTFSPDFSFSSSLVKVTDPVAKIYRDKRVADDFEEKPFYSKAIRNLGFALEVDRVEVENGELIYEEHVKSDKQAGTLRFSDMQVAMTNIGNQYSKTEPTEIKLSTNFMDNTPLKVDWNFVVQDSTDQFTFEADLGNFKAEAINPFSEPNLLVRFSGELNQTYFTISGGPDMANIDLKIKYNDFKVALIDDSGEEKKKFLSGLLNIFIKKDSDGKAENYHYGYADQVERNKTKSIFNFVWINTQKALLTALTDGQKKP